MRISLLLLAAVSITGAQASWFGTDTPQYSSWSAEELQQWLQAHDIDIPAAYQNSQSALSDLVKSHWGTYSTWTADRYASAQKYFADTKVESWDESRLREFLLDQGVVKPSGSREQLVLLAKQRYAGFQNAASSLSASASSTVYGGKASDASRSIASATSVVGGAAAQASKDVARALDDSKDYVYSSWDNNRLRDYLEEKGVLTTKAEKKRGELLALMHKAYASATDPVWHVWSDSYLHEWLVAHGVIRSDYEKNRDALQAKMAQYYYGPRDAVYDAWSDSQLKEWLVAHDVVKPDSQIKREKLIKLVHDNYANAKDTAYSAWSDSDMRAYLIDNGYLRSDAQVRRDALVDLMHKHYTAASDRVSAYLTWPDARLRAYLRQRGLPESALPTGRPGLLQETRVRWVQAEGVLERLRGAVGGGVGAAEEKIGRVLEMLGGHAEAGGKAVKEKGEGIKNEL
ncbi:hypothetical protein PLICRDRAFT_47061 [Plicaturopsis crispa FD-325 SS-3]|uniref:Unplaced genomic scaffold PLICRscaffold_22, whole genome shotgun sequence n=1 Tax=Plicaturopsis crispa FD-325 SS-3 TaxID=944288 RepID=A0A0C9T2W3_PLICR|nr:hypothetical protein PLICRDRAFT_47061 [Plicaturopsis crispa FD-325 SS-3]